MSELVDSELVMKWQPLTAVTAWPILIRARFLCALLFLVKRYVSASRNRSKRVLFADAIEILEPSPDRVPSVWPAAGPGGVGGGELAHVSLKAQRTWKRWVLQDCLTRLGGAQVAEQLSQVGLPQVAGFGLRRR